MTDADLIAAAARAAEEHLIHQRAATIEACAVVCEAWGQAKVQKWQDDPEMLEYSEARAWDAMKCAVAVRKLADEVPHG